MYAKWKQEVGDPLLPNEWPPRSRIGINGSGLIARQLIRCSIKEERGIDIVAVNAYGVTPELLAYLIKYDSQCGPCPGVVSNVVTMQKPAHNNASKCLYIEVCGRKIAVFAHKNPIDIPWDWLDVEYVIETSSKLVKLTDAEKHLRGGRARKVIVVGDTCDIPALLYPISYKTYQRGTSIISTGSPNSLAFGTLVYLIEEQFGILEGIGTIISSYTDNQKTVDSQNALEWRLGRGAVQSIIPINIQPALKTILQALPSMQGRIGLTGFSVPTATGSVVDFTCILRDKCANTEDFIKKLREGDILRTLQNVHKKCQPGWLLRKWCPEEVANAETPLPVIDCSPNVDSRKPFTMADVDEELNVPRKLMTPMPSSKPPVSPRFFKEQVKEIPPSIVEFWEGEQLCVSSDVQGLESMAVLDTHSCLSLKDGSMLKILTWFDKDLSFILRIIDTIVFMRYVDHG